MKKLTFLILISLTIFACNKKDDPQPTNNNNGTTPPPTTTNTPPTVSAIPSSSTNPTTITVNATDTDGTIAKVEVFNGSTLLTTLTTSPYIYTLPTLANGSYTYTIKATDNSNVVSSTSVSFTVSATPTPKDNTVATLSSFYGTVNGLYNLTTISSTSFTTTATQPSGGFFIGAASAGTYNYTVLSNGNIQFVAGAFTIEYSVQVSSGYLVLTNVNNSSQDNIYTLYK